MTTREETFPVAEAERPFAALEARLTRLLYVDAELLAYGVIFVLAIITRFWDLGTRVMSHDESLHTRYSWNLYHGDGFAHTPLMHGPLLFHVTALMYLLFGDNDFSARIYPAVVGIGVVMLPYFMRRWLGKYGALAASTLLLISPLIMYYSRYIREDMPSLFYSAIMALCAWRYIEYRKFRYLVIFAAAQFGSFATKEVSFIYVAIFGSFLTLYFVIRLLEVEWTNRSLYRLFLGALIVLILLGAGIAAVTMLDEPAETVALPAAGEGEVPVEPEQPTSALDVVRYALLGLFALAIVTLVGAVIVGQWRNLRMFPELDVAIVMGTLILPMLTPFVINFAGFDSMDESPEGIRTSFLFTLPFLLISVLVGLIWGMQPPGRRLVTVPDYSAQAGTGEDAFDASSSIPTRTVEVEPDLWDWVQAFLYSRWWAIGAVFWVLVFFFFTTMFTNGAGLGTGVIGSLGYWLQQQEVKRGNQPWYYYILLMAPVYEFLPMILTAVAGFIGLRRVVRRSVTPPDDAEVADTAADDLDDEVPVRHRAYRDLSLPVRFPVLLFMGYWTVMNFIAYSIAGEKMPWLTTHVTFPMCLLGGWVIGRLLEAINWQRLWNSRGWVLLILLPIFGIALLRVAAPICTLVALPVPQVTPGGVPGQDVTWGEAFLGALRLPCNTIVPTKYQQPLFSSPSIADLSNTYAWLSAVVVFLIVTAAIVVFSREVGFRQVRKLATLSIVGALALVTARSALIASFVNYDDATEYLVYAHSSGAVKDVLDQIDEISLKTTDGYGLRVAYDNKVSWPYSWYFRDYYNAVYYGDQPSRGLIGDAPVILAGPDNWTKVEPMLGDRYYSFEYIRMWWPMQDYFDLDANDIKTFFTDPQMQRGVWDIFMRRDYDAYADAVTKYRSSRPDFSLSEWPVAERMRLYIRKDVFAEVWDYGVAASEIAAATDPYAEGVRNLTPSTTFGAGLLTRPHGAEIGPDGLLYVADSGNHRIVVFDPATGEVVRTMGSFGLAPQPEVLNEPWDVAVAPDGTVYVADTWNHRVVQFAADGSYVRNWGFEGPNSNDPNAFWGPRGIATDREGNVYVADTGNKRIVVFDAEGFFVRQIGLGGAADGQLDEPVGVAVGPDDLLYVADTWNQRIEVFTRDGVFVRQWPIDAWYAQSNERPYLTADNQGRVYVTDPEAFRVIVFDGTGQYQYSFGDYTTIGLAGSVAVEPQGAIFVVDTANQVIQRYDSVEGSGPQQ